MLENESASAAVENACNFLNSDVGCRAFDGGTGGQHLSLSGGREVAVIGLVERHASHKRVLGLVVLGRVFDVEGGGGADHASLLRGSNRLSRFIMVMWRDC